MHIDLEGILWPPQGLQLLVSQVVHVQITRLPGSCQGISLL